MKMMKALVVDGILIWTRTVLRATIQTWALKMEKDLVIIVMMDMAPHDPAMVGVSNSL
jgi:hypothetical protein